jgi:hypothetical protein
MKLPTTRNENAASWKTNQKSQVLKWSSLNAIRLSSDCQQLRAGITGTTALKNVYWLQKRAKSTLIPAKMGHLPKSGILEIRRGKIPRKALMLVPLYWQFKSPPNNIHFSYHSSINSVASAGTVAVHPKQWFMVKCNSYIPSDIHNMRQTEP